MRARRVVAVLRCADGVLPAPPRERPLTGRTAPRRRVAAAAAAAAGALDWWAARVVRVAAGGYLRHTGCFYRAPASLVQQRIELRANRDESWFARATTVAI